MKRWLAGAVALVVCICVMGSRAQAAGALRSGAQNLITMNFQNVDIPVLAKFISEITGKNFVIDESVRGKVSIISPTKVTPEQAYSIFQSVLQLKGFTTVRAGPVIKIVPARQVRQSAALTTSQHPGETGGDQYVTRMIKLKNIEASSLVSVIQPMVSHDGLVAAFPQDNTLILTDDAYNIQRLLKIIGSLDVRGVQQNIEVIPLKIAFADDVASKIDKLMGEEGSSGQTRRVNIRRRPGMGVVAPSARGPEGSFKIVPDERTNSLIVLAGPIQMRTIKELIAKLDVHPPNETARIRVYHLKNAQASEIVQVLNGLLGGSGAPSTLSPVTGRNSLGRGSALGNFGGSFNPGFGGGYGGGYGSSFGGYGSNSGFGGAMGSPMMSNRGSATSAAPVTASTGGSGSSGTGTGHSSIFENAVSVTADPATNSLIISASPQDYQTLHRVIEKLDVPRIQVFVQAILVEVSAERARNIGVNFQSATNLSNSTLGVAQLNFGQLQTALANPLGLTGLGIGLASGSTCSIPVNLASAVTQAAGASGIAGPGSSISVPCDVALMTALETDSHTNVLSAPTLLTADNEEAMIVVGENLPFVGSAAANAGLPGQIFNSVERQNVGITLDIIPQVSQGDYVRLDVYEEVSNVVNTAQSLSNPLGPTTTIRSASTTVMVQDHRTAVIGGLLSNEDDIQRSGVPFISDIPVIGNLFSNNSSDKRKLNLLVFLTPHVIRTRTDLRSLSLDERKKFIEALGRREMHQMPIQQYNSINMPTFSIPVSPAQDLRSGSGSTAPGAGFGVMPSSKAVAPSSGPGPNSRNSVGNATAPVTASVVTPPATTAGKTSSTATDP